MEKLTLSDLSLLVAPQTGPCLSLYLGAGSTSAERAIRYRKLLRHAEKLLAPHGRQGERLLNSLRFFSMNHPAVREAAAFACFSSPTIEACLPLAAPTPDLCTVASGFHLEPLLALLHEGKVLSSPEGILPHARGGARETESEAACQS